MYILLLLLDNPDHGDAVMRAWTELGIRGIYALESTSCRAPGETGPRAPMGLQTLAGLFGDGHICHVLLLAAAGSLALAEQAAGAVERIAGPWPERGTAALFALPVAASWGAALDPGPAPGERDARA